MNYEEIFEALEEEHINSQMTDIGLEIMRERVRVATELTVSALSDQVISNVTKLSIDDVKAIRRGWLTHLN